MRFNILVVNILKSGHIFYVTVINPPLLRESWQNIELYQKSSRIIGFWAIIVACDALTRPIILIIAESTSKCSPAGSNYKGNYPYDR